MFLPTGTRVFRLSVAVQAAFIADADALPVETPAVCADPFYRAGRLDIPILADVKMIPCPVETAAAVADVQIMFGEGFILACRGAMHHNHINRSHALSGIFLDTLQGHGFREPAFEREDFRVHLLHAIAQAEIIL